MDVGSGTGILSIFAGNPSNTQLKVGQNMCMESKKQTSINTAEI
jgi:hypothetical protein